MRAAYYEKQGPARDVLRVGELPDPEVGIGEVRVRVAVSGLNPTDIKSRTGFAGVPLLFPLVVPHQDGAGVIDQVGAGVPASRIGERVWLYEAQSGKAFGTAAEFVVLPARQAVALPAETSFEAGATLGIAALTAHRCLFADGDVRGRWVLVQGGAGAVGTAAILLAKWAGALVIATVSRSEQAVMVHKLGADVVINRKAEDVKARVLEVTAGQGVDRIVDVDLVANIETDMACLATRGVITAYATEEPTAEVRFPFLRTMFKGAVVRMVFVYTMGEQAHADAVRDVNACLASGKYQPIVGLELPLDRIADAHEAQETGRVIGKILVHVRGGL